MTFPVYNFAFSQKHKEGRKKYEMKNGYKKFGISKKSELGKSYFRHTAYIFCLYICTCVCVYGCGGGRLAV